MAAALVSLTALTVSCVGPSGDQTIEVLPPYGANGADFAPVSGVLERRCANLDCHGSPFRALRIYSKYGLRRPEVSPTPYLTQAELDNSYYSGGVPTTVAEIADNYDAVVLLEPILTQEVVAAIPREGAPDPCPWYPESGQPVPVQVTPECLTLVRKPLLIEKHKGGQIWKAGTDAELCLRGWLVGSPRETYGASCAKDLATPN
jgi:hypothetical protein